MTTEQRLAEISRTMDDMEICRRGQKTGLQYSVLDWFVAELDQMSHLHSLLYGELKGMRFD